MINWISERLDKISYTFAGIGGISSGISLEHAVMIIPAVISVAVSIATWRMRVHQVKKQNKIFRQNEARKTRILCQYLRSRAQQDKQNDAKN